VNSDRGRSETGAGEAPRRVVGLAEAARAVLAARSGGPALAVVGRADEAGGGVRVLVYEDGTVRGTLGDARLDRAAAEVGAALLESEDQAWTLESEGGEATLYAEVHRSPARLFVVGAGHIAVPLVRLGLLLGFPVVVLDDREEMATEERFPGAVVRPLDFDAPFRDEAVRGSDFVVLVTRAHKYDYDCLRALLDAATPPRYIGMVGSRRRVRAAFRALLEAGVDRGRIEAVHAPIGVGIGAETPEEIAVSIAAELVAVRRGVEAGGSLRDRERVVERYL
jgi:xanthine dehydrogenase accessory factor